MAKPNATLTDKPASKEASKHKKPPLAVAIMLGFLALLAAYIFATGGNAKSVTIAPRHQPANHHPKPKQPTQARWVSLVVPKASDTA